MMIQSDPVYITQARVFLIRYSSIDPIQDKQKKPPGFASFQHTRS